MSNESNSEVGEPIGRLETDTFCPHCNYNLLSQAVLRDRRLQILVVRCPECGRFMAVGHETASRAWFNRLIIVFAANWVIFVATLLLATTFFLGMMSFGMAMAFARFQTTPQVNAAGVTVSYEYHYEPRRPSDYPNAGHDLQMQKIAMNLLTVALGFVAGGLVTVLLWHLRGWRRWLAVLMPLVGCGCAVLLFSLDPEFATIRSWGQPRIAAAGGVELLGLFIGLLLGRPLARGILRMLAPPRLRQHFAFLWIVDGKKLIIEPTG